MADQEGAKQQDFEKRLSDSESGIAEFERSHRGFVGTVQHVLHANPTLVPVIVLIVAIAVFGLIAGERFFSPFNLTLIMQQVSIIGILAAAQSLVIITAGIDLSVAAIMVLMSVISGKLAVEFGVPWRCANRQGATLNSRMPYQCVPRFTSRSPGAVGVVSWFS